MKNLCYFFGAFLVMPIKLLEFGGVSYKLDDVILVFLSVIFLIHRPVKFRLIGCFLVFLLYLYYGALVLLYNDMGASFQVFLRILQVLAVVVVLSMMKIEERVSMLNGIANWGPVFAGCLIMYLIWVLDYSPSNLLDDQQYYKDFFNLDRSFLSVHINTVGTVLLLSIYLNALRYRVTRKFQYLLLCGFMLLPSLMLVSKGDLLAVIVAFVFFIFSRLRVTFLFFVFLIVCATLLLFTDQLSMVDPVRQIIYSTALREFVFNPFGYGLGTEQQVIFEASGVNYPAHNFLLSAALESGVIGVVFFLTLIVYSYHKNSNIISRSFLVAFIVVGAFGNVMYFYKYHFVFFMMVNIFFDKTYCKYISDRDSKMSCGSKKEIL